MFKLTRALALVLAAATCLGTASAAPIIFADFNTDEGPFNVAPNFSGTSVGESNLSTADRVTTDGPKEGAGHQKLVLVHDGSTTNMRIRHLAGGGSPTGTAQQTFTTSAGVDGYIGFYAKTAASNAAWTLALNLDDSANNAAGMDMGVAKTIIADDQWHLYEWNLDDDNEWVAVTGIGGDGTIQDGQHSIDSIYIFTNTTGATGEARAPLYIDFVAKSDSGSIAALVPEPAAAMLALAASLGMLGLVRRR
ncbi:MAG: hypothetical protein DCC67_08745 [Planctomycetota bacterium]|nr:MAG: hypothetical protein DCC67_08745 [Planctomycetota bacterium]